MAVVILTDLNKPFINEKQEVYLARVCSSTYWTNVEVIVLVILVLV